MSSGPFDSADGGEFEYQPGTTAVAYGFEELPDDHDQHLLDDSIARIEALKVKALELTMLGQETRDLIFRDLDILRRAIIHFASTHQPHHLGPERRQDVLDHAGKKTELRLEGIIGMNARITKILELIGSVAATDLPVLLEGETGTGKELFARIIHLNSPRDKFVAVNCGAFPPGVIESELFGHERGSFTGANQERKGKFEEADGGTIFLDEIGDLEPTAQVKLLRALEQGEIQRVGSDRSRRVEVRMIAATNHCLESMVEEGRFREDLFYRVSVCPVTLPPLRERRDEIPILLDYFLQEASAKMGRRVPAIDRELRSFIYSVYDFPGNIRELRNLARFMACLGGEHPVRLRDLPERYRRARGMKEETAQEEEGEGASWRETVVREAEKAYWADLLRRHNGRVKQLCEETGLSRSRVYEILSEYGLKPGSFR